jgi:PRTRC genetic system protein C
MSTRCARLTTQIASPSFESINLAIRPTTILWRNEIMPTTTLKISSLPRTFVFNGSPLPDPDPKMSVEEVRELLTPAYPELATAKLTGPEDTGTSLRYSFSREIGTKG